jgi:hypothetical protein
MMNRARRFSIVAALALTAVLWTVSGNAGTLNVTGDAAYVGLYGLEVVVDDTSDTYVQDNTPNHETRYRARFYVRLNPLTMAVADEFDLFTAFSFDGVTKVLRLSVYFDGADLRLRYVAMDGVTETVPGAGIVLADGWRSVEIDWQASTAPGADDGFLDLWVDGQPQTGLTGLANDGLSVGSVRWGAVAALDAGTGGSCFLDAFESRRAGYIGLETVFTDVAPADWTLPYILAVYNAGVSAGCFYSPPPDGTGERRFCPDLLTNRQETAVQMLRTSGVYNQPDYEGIFSDMPVCDSDPAVFCWSRWAEEYFRQGISAGCFYNPDTGERRFCPNQSLNRREAAVQFQRMLGIFDQPDYEGIFSDMPVCDPNPAVFCWSRWAEEFFRQGMTAGCYYNPDTGERRFCPMMEISRSHMAVFLQRTFVLPKPTL